MYEGGGSHHGVNTRLPHHPPQRSLPGCGCCITGIKISAYTTLTGGINDRVSAPRGAGSAVCIGVSGTLQTPWHRWNCVSPVLRSLPWWRVTHADGHMRNIWLMCAMTRFGGLAHRCREWNEMMRWVPTSHGSPNKLEIMNSTIMLTDNVLYWYVSILTYVLRR